MSNTTVMVKIWEAGEQIDDNLIVSQEAIEGIANDNPDVFEVINGALYAKLDAEDLVGKEAYAEWENTPQNMATMALECALCDAVDCPHRAPSPGTWLSTGLLFGDVH